MQTSARIILIVTFVISMLISACVPAINVAPAPEQVQGMPTKHPSFEGDEDIQDFILEPDKDYTLRLNVVEGDGQAQFVVFRPDHLLGITMSGFVYKGIIPYSPFQVWADLEAIPTAFASHGIFASWSGKAKTGKADDWLILINVADASVYSGMFYDPYFAQVKNSDLK